MESLTNQFLQTNVSGGAGGDVSSICSFKGQGLQLNHKDQNQINQALDVARQISNCSQGLETLEFTGNTVGVEAADSIKEALKRCPKLKRLLWSDMFTGKLKEEIPTSLKSLCNGLQFSQCQLTELDLSDNAFGPNGVSGFKDFLAETQTVWSLKVLKLNNNGLGIAGGCMLADSLMRAWSASSKAGRPLQLQVFIAGRNRLENEGAEALSKVFSALGSLVQLELPQNGIRSEGIGHLAEALKKNPHMRILNLHDNTFGKAGGVSMGSALPGLKELEVLNFDDCLLKTQGGIAVLRGTTENKSLKELRLAGNELEKVIFKPLMASLKNKRAISVIDLNGNCFGEGGVKSLLSLLSGSQRSALADLEDDEGSEVSEEEESEAEEGGSDAESDQESSEEVEPECDRGVAVSTANADGTAAVALVENGVHFESFGLGDEIDNSDAVARKFKELCTRVTPLSAEPVTIEIAKDCRALLVKHFETCETAPINFVNALVPHMGLIKGEREGSGRGANTFGILKILTLISDVLPKNIKDVLAFVVESKAATIGMNRVVSDFLLICKK